MPMETSILTSTKKILGLAEDYTAFDLDVITHINSSFMSLQQLGVIPEVGYQIEDDGPKWEDLGLSISMMSAVRSWMYQKVRMLFDPPALSFVITAMNDQIAQFEWRISTLREWELDPVDPMLEELEEVEV